MRLKFKNKYFIGIFIGAIILVLDFMLFFRTKWFISLIILALTAGWLQFWMDFFAELKRQKEIELKFLEFIRSLVGTVKSGIPVPAAILHVANEDYGALSPYIKKLSNQIEWGIPIHQALINFSNDTENSVIKRSISIVIEADKSGGEISDVLESVRLRTDGISCMFTVGGIRVMPIGVLQRGKLIDAYPESYCIGVPEFVARAIRIRGCEHFERAIDKSPVKCG